jgi:uncharacterized integral membrane protein
MSERNRAHHKRKGAKANLQLTFQRIRNLPVTAVAPGAKTLNYLENLPAPKRCRRAANGNGWSAPAQSLKSPSQGEPMNFLRTLFWVVLAVSLAIFANRNWNDVTVTLWGNIQADVKLPFLLLITFLVGFLPPYLIMRGRVWNLRRKLAVAERPAVAAPSTAPAEESDEALA